MSNRAIIGIGSNLQSPGEQVRRAIRELSALPGCRLVQASSLYRSAPLGPADQPDYINAVAELETRLDAHSLLDRLQALELQHGRVRDGERWGPRTLDLDILLFNTDVIHDDRLHVPHPGMAGRNFVLYPLAEIMPGAEIPGLGKLADLLATCPENGLQKLGTGS